VERTFFDKLLAPGSEFNRRHTACLTRIADEIGVPSASMEDVIQDTWLEAVKHRHLFHGVDGEQNPSVWLQKVVCSKSVGEIRRLDRRQTESLDGSRSELADLAAAKRAKAAENGEWLKTMMDALAEHHSEYRWILCERFLKERPIKGLAEEKGVTEHAIHCQITRALQELCRLMSAHPGCEERQFRKRRRRSAAVRVDIF
jgi:RNA polymerase sigma factor (sigma-70 family)